MLVVFLVVGAVVVGSVIASIGGVTTRLWLVCSIVLVIVVVIVVVAVVVGVFDVAVGRRCGRRRHERIGVGMSLLLLLLWC